MVWKEIDRKAQENQRINNFLLVRFMDFISAKAIIKCENFFYFIFIWPICIHNSLFSWCCCCCCCSSSHSFSCVPFVIDNSFWNRSLAHKMCHCLCCCWCMCVCALVKAFCWSDGFVPRPNRSTDPVHCVLLFSGALKIIQNYCSAISLFTSDKH